MSFRKLIVSSIELGLSVQEQTFPTSRKRVWILTSEDFLIDRQ